MDRYLDTARSGPMYLGQPPIAATVIEVIFRGRDIRHFELGSFVVMTNHLHLLLLPKVAPSYLLRALKGVSAREANLLMCRTGEPFRQRESYDRWVRDEQERLRIAAYIERNPVHAGHAVLPEDYRWSSANPEYRERLSGGTA